MVLNDLNILMKNDKIVLEDRGRPCAFFPIKWRIDWSFDSGGNDSSYYSGSSCSFNINFNWRYSQTVFVDAVKDGKILKGTVTSTYSNTNCTADITTSNREIVRITLTQSEAGRFSASGSIELIADHYNGVTGSARGVNVLDVLREIQAFDGTALFSFDDPWGYFPDYTFSRTVTMIGEEA